MASTFSASPGGVASPVSVSEQKIPITILILKRGPCLGWAGAPFDLQLVAKVSAHGDLLLNFAFDCLNILIGWDGGSSQWDAPIVLSHSCFHRGHLDKLWANSGDTEAGKGRHSGL